MNKLLFGLCLVTLVCEVANASDQELDSQKRLLLFDSSLEFKMNDLENVRPDPALCQSMGWGGMFYSGLCFDRTHSINKDTVDGFDDSQRGTYFDQDVFRVNLLSMYTRVDKAAFSIGGVFNYRNIKREEFGYLQFPASLVDDYVAFNNDALINVSQIGLQLSGLYQGDFLRFRVATEIMPKTGLSLEQNTGFKPIVAQEGTLKHEQSQGLSYRARLELQSNLKTFIDVRLAVTYEKLPIAYKTLGLDYDVASSNFSFSQLDINTVENTFTLEGRIILNITRMWDMSPYVGLARQSADVEDLNSNSTITDTQWYGTLGLTALF